MKNSLTRGSFNSNPNLLLFLVQLCAALISVVFNAFKDMIVAATSETRLYWQATRAQYELVKLRAYVITVRLTNSFGHSGYNSAKTGAKALLVVIILILIIPAVGLVFTGGTTGSTGVYTNVTVANNARNGVAQFSQFIGIAMILGVVGVIIGLVG